MIQAWIYRTAAGFWLHHQAEYELGKTVSDKDEGGFHKVYNNFYKTEVKRMKRMGE